MSGIELTELGEASASQLMAAVESRELVGAANSFAPPKCAEARGPHSEREQKAEQHLEDAHIRILCTASAFGT